jgi:hypothetical protein
MWSGSTCSQSSRRCSAMLRLFAPGDGWAHSAESVLIFMSRPVKPARRSRPGWHARSDAVMRRRFPKSSRMARGERRPRKSVLTSPFGKGRRLLRGYLVGPHLSAMQDAKDANRAGRHDVCGGRAYERPQVRACRRSGPVARFPESLTDGEPQGRSAGRYERPLSDFRPRYV